jgi:hypothetical protein
LAVRSAYVRSAYANFAPLPAGVWKFQHQPLHDAKFPPTRAERQAENGGNCCLFRRLRPLSTKTCNLLRR